MTSSLTFSPPYDVANQLLLSTRITITGSTFSNTIYHYLTIYSFYYPTLSPCNYLTFSFYTFLSIYFYSIYFYYYYYSTPFNTY